MAFVLTPRFAPAYQAPQCNPFGFCAPLSRPSYGYRVARPRPQRPQYSPFNHFFNEVDELLGEIDREAKRQARIEAHREAHRQRQQRKRALRADFAVHPIEQGWQVEGDIHGFGQENISIDVTDEHTLKIVGNTEWQSEKTAEPEPELQKSLEPAPEVEASAEGTDDAALEETEKRAVSEPETETATADTADSDTASQRSYQATVEDDFEDLGAETSSLISSSSEAVAEAKEPKGKEKAAENTASSETTVAQQTQTEAPVETQSEEIEQEERVHGSFERTFRFPQRIDAANVSAAFKDGVLKINVPRAQAPQARRIAIL